MNHPSSVQHHADQTSSIAEDHMLSPCFLAQQSFCPVPIYLAKGLLSVHPFNLIADEMRPPFVEKQNAWRPPWSVEEDVEILSRHGHGAAGEGRRQLMWNVNNYPRRDHGNNHDKSFGDHEEELIIKLHATIGSRWAIIAQQLPGRTESEVKNCWNTKLKKRLTEMGIDPVTHKPFSQVLRDYDNIGGNARGVGNRIGSIHHSKDQRNAYLSNSNSKSQQHRRQQQQFTPIQFHARPSKATALMLNSPPTSLLSPLSKSAAESLSWSDFLVGDYGFPGDHFPNEATGGLPFLLPDDPYGLLTPGGNAVECLSSSSSSSSAADDSFVETILNKHTEMFMDFPEIWDESIR